MIRILVKPTKKSLTIRIPNEYINKDIEVLLFPIDVGIKESYGKSSCTMILNKTKGMLKKYKIDPVKWQKQIREEYER
ncbi:MAG: hypothetical protein N3F66_05870 [Spirochaetes bacterium]|nr:hypothetical protein [Spirochaetota bacterium]